MSNKEAQVEESRAKLLEVATRIFGQKGFDGASIREISEAAGLNVSLISYYFGGKEGLYRTIIKDHAEDVKRRLYGLLALQNEKITDVTVKATFKQLISWIIRENVEQPDLKAILQHEINGLMPHSKDLFETHFNQSALALGDYIARAQAAGVIRPDIDPLVFFMSLVFAVERFFQASRCKTQLMCDTMIMPKDAAKLEEHIYKIFFEGGLVR